MKVKNWIYDKINKLLKNRYIRRGYIRIKRYPRIIKLPMAVFLVLKEELLHANLGGGMALYRRY